MSSVASAHTYNAIRTTIASNPNSDHVEIIHKVFIDDLNTVVSRELSEFHELSNETSDLVWIREYWTERFAMTSPDGTPIVLEWVGAEFDDHFVWVYQEYTGPVESLSKFWVANRLLFGEFKHQINTVDIAIGGSKEALIFTQHAVRHLVELKPSSTKPAIPKPPHTHAH
ncbi:DUF6702 family protein [Echinimonas agarilytica]|uniref:Uncharacterized protein n=1 Tax=Echinimonas agarilytica TaxID=1215918 RepID=A0AA42B5Z8_9GAMM|nr:DUF6702 family protein [Echinimonas agarilytica]MCM2678129.1 hypothetical protein [Echinimonas agarilytica]